MDIAEKKSIQFSFSANIDSLEIYFDKDKIEKILFSNSLTGKTPIEFIRTIRCSIVGKKWPVKAEVAYEVGFNNPKKLH